MPSRSINRKGEPEGCIDGIGLRKLACCIALDCCDEQLLDIAALWGGGVRHASEAPRSADHMAARAARFVLIFGAAV